MELRNRSNAFFSGIHEVMSGSAVDVDIDEAGNNPATFRVDLRDIRSRDTVSFGTRAYIRNDTVGYGNGSVLDNAMGVTIRALTT